MQFREVVVLVHHDHIKKKIIIIIIIIIIKLLKEAGRSPLGLSLGGAICFPAIRAISGSVSCCWAVIYSIYPSLCPLLLCNMFNLR